MSEESEILVYQVYLQLIDEDYDPHLAAKILIQVLLHAFSEAERFE